MAKPKKDGKRATGVQGKSGYLYIISYQHIMKDGVKVRQKQWISTGLKDTADNVKKALSQGITLHGLRSSCVSILVHQGMDVKSIQKWVGHADIDTTLRIYAKVKDKEAKREISDAMNGIISLKDYSSNQ